MWSAEQYISQTGNGVFHNIPDPLRPRIFLKFSADNVFDHGLSSVHLEIWQSLDRTLDCPSVDRKYVYVQGLKAARPKTTRNSTTSTPNHRFTDKH